MGAMASQITSLTIVYSTVYSGADQRKHLSSAPVAFVRGIHRWSVNFPHKGPVTRKMFPFDDAIMWTCPSPEKLREFRFILCCHKGAMVWPLLSTYTHVVYYGGQNRPSTKWTKYMLVKMHYGDVPLQSCQRAIFMGIMWAPEYDI